MRKKDGDFFANTDFIVFPTEESRRGGKKGGHVKEGDRVVDKDHERNLCKVLVVAND